MVFKTMLRGFTFIELSIYIAIFAFVTLSAVSLKNSYTYNQKIHQVYIDVEKIVNKTFLLRNTSGGDFSTISTSKLIGYGGFWSESILDGNHLSSPLGEGSYYTVSPYLVSGIPKGFSIKVFMTDKQYCFDVFAMSKYVSKYAVSVKFSNANGSINEAWNSNLGIDSFLTSAQNICSSVSPWYSADIYINTMVSDGHVLGRY